MQKMIELSDALSMHKNGMQTITEPITVSGRMNECNILFESMSENFQTVLASCKMDSVRSFFLMEKESRLPFGMTRKEIKESGMDFLFKNLEGNEGEWKFSFDLNDDENSTKYQKVVDMISSYEETPIRDLFSGSNLQARFITYSPIEGKTKDVDGISIVEIGYNLEKNSGLVYFYNYRVIPETEVNYL
jgi:hypothetical protein